MSEKEYKLEMFKKYPDQQPSFKSNYYLTIINIDGLLSYSISYYNEDCEFDKLKGKVVAFTEVDPIDIFNNL